MLVPICFQVDRALVWQKANPQGTMSRLTENHANQKLTQLPWGEFRIVLSLPINLKNLHLGARVELL